MRPVSVPVDLFERIDQLETRFKEREPLVQAFLPEEGRFSRLREEARRLSSMQANAAVKAPLWGSIVGVKDIFHVDGFVTRAGSRLPVEALRGKEAESVRRIKEAGGLILGKTVTTEFAYFSPGPTHNPRNLDHTPGGSSSGSAAAVADGLCDLALGTQTIGSIIRPAAFCGVVGLKPSYERISREGVIPLAPSLDHVGLFAPTVNEARNAARVLYKDWQDNPAVPKKPVLGIPDGPYLKNAGREGTDQFDGIARLLVSAGYAILHVPAMPDFDEIRACNDVILASEASRVHAAWFDEYEELYAPKTAELIQRGRCLKVSDLENALKRQPRLREEISALMDENGIDAWITPSAPGPAPKGLDSTGDPVMNLPWTLAGMPAINIPSGRNRDGLPFGLQTIGRFYTDESLLGWAVELEKVLGSR